MKQFALILAILSFADLYAGDLSLFDCYEKAERMHPLQHERRNRQEIYELNRKNLNAKWLPSLSANANAVYMSNVVEFDQVLGSLPFPISPGTFSTMPKDQYKITFDVHQTIYDGGAVGAAKKVELAVLQTDLQVLQTELYKIREKVNEVYFALLMLEKQAELAAIFNNEILQRRATLLSGVQNGVILSTNVDILDAELLNMEQHIFELAIQKDKVRQVLSDLIGEDTGESAFMLPAVHIPDESSIRRPEIELFERQKCALEMSKKMAISQRMPKAVVYGTYGYGQPPGSDFFKNNFDTYYIVGAAVSWNFFNWNTTKRTRQALQAQQNIIDAKEAYFAQQVQIALKNIRAEIKRIKALLESDEKLIALREKIKKAAISKLNNGTISSTEFLAELNAERQARINFEMHKIQWVQAKVNYLTISGQPVQ